MSAWPPPASATESIVGSRSVPGRLAAVVATMRAVRSTASARRATDPGCQTRPRSCPVGTARATVERVIPIVPVVAATSLLGFAPAGTGPAGGTLLTGTFPGTERPGLVYLPPGFEAGHRYRVVYLL